MSASDLLGFCPDSSAPVSAPVALPEPSLPPRAPGEAPVPLSVAVAEREAGERRAQARAQTSNGYPFMTKRELKEKLATNPDFQRDCLKVIYERQTDQEVAQRDTIDKNKRGFMSSHAVHGTRIAELLLAGEPLELEDEDRMAAMVVSYSKQLAAHFRQIALRENPALAAQAAKFGIGAV